MPFSAALVNSSRFTFDFSVNSHLSEEDWAMHSKKVLVAWSELVPNFVLARLMAMLRKTMAVWGPNRLPAFLTFGGMTYSMVR